MRAPAPLDHAARRSRAETRAAFAESRALLDSRLACIARAARGARGAAGQEPGGRRAHDAARARREGGFERGAARAARRCATCSRSRRPSCSTCSGSRRCATPAATRAAIEASPFSSGIARRWTTSSADPRATSRRRSRQSARSHEMMAAMTPLLRRSTRSRRRRRRRSRCSVPGGARPPRGALRARLQGAGAWRAGQFDAAARSSSTRVALAVITSSRSPTARSRTWIRPSSAAGDAAARVPGAVQRRLEGMGRIQHARADLVARIAELDAQRRGARRAIARARRARRSDRGASRGPTSAARRERGLARATRRPSFSAHQPSYLACSCSRVSTCSGSSGMQSTGQTSTALRLVEVADALGAARRVDHVDLRAHARSRRSGTRARRRRS